MAEFQTNACGTICLCLLNLLAIRCLQLWCQLMGPLCLWECLFCNFYLCPFVNTALVLVTLLQCNESGCSNRCSSMHNTALRWSRCTEEVERDVRSHASSFGQSVIYAIMHGKPGLFSRLPISAPHPIASKQSPSNCITLLSNCISQKQPWTGADHSRSH